MQFPESWLREFVNPDCSTEELAHRLTMAGLEVEETEPVAPAFSGVVVARIESVEPHPNADKLRICSVNAGQPEMLQIVCGAPNAEAGLVVPLAAIGAVLPGGMKIGRAKMRGVESFGMLCSARELGLSQDHAGLMPLPADLIPGTDFRQALSLDETVFVLKLTPNRADCLSILGVAREVAAITHTPATDRKPEPASVTISDRIEVDVQAPDLCGRFAGRVVRGVNARAQTPDWMVQRLERAGQRSVSALVDISNYLMLERGRPTHVFDLSKLSEPRLCVRWARTGESIKLLNEETVELHPGLGVITCGDEAESLAGIMGGDKTAVSLDTTDVYLEAAFWWPESIAGRTRELKLASEAAHRFERGVDFANIVEDLERLTSMVIDICGGHAGPLDDQIINLPERKPVQMRLARCQKVLGIDCTQDQVGAAFDSLRLEWIFEAGVFTVTPPSYRFDLEIEEGLIEEVARLIGFDEIPAKPPLAAAKMDFVPETYRPGRVLRQAICARDYQEVINFSFVEADWERQWLGHENPIELLNPIASQMSVMRSSLLPGLVSNIAYNANRRQTRVRVFELGRVYWRDESVTDGDLSVAGVSQPLRLAGAAWGPADYEQWGLTARQVDFFDVKRDVEVLYGPRAKDLKFEAAEHPLFHPGRCARVMLDGAQQGWLGEMHPRWVRDQGLSSAPVMFELPVDSLSAVRMPTPKALSKQPVVQRDMALWVDADTPADQLLDTMRALVRNDPELSIVQEIALFDVWQDKQSQTSPDIKRQVSLAFRVWMQDPAVTLEDERVDASMLKLREALQAQHNARPR